MDSPAERAIRMLHADVIALRVVVGQLVGDAALKADDPRAALSRFFERASMFMDAFEDSARDERAAGRAAMARERLNALFGMVAKGINDLHGSGDPSPG